MGRRMEAAARASRRARSNGVAGLVAALVVIGGAPPAQADVRLTEQRSWTTVAYADHDCKVYPLDLAGPGVASVRLKMTPYLRREFATWAEEIVTHELPDIGRYLGRTLVAGTGQYGQPVDKIDRWFLSGSGTTKLNVRICNPVKCNFAGHCTQYQATATVVVDFAQGADPATAPAPTAAPVPAPAPAPAPPVAHADSACWTGRWQSNFGTVSLRRDGDQVTGSYEHDQGRLVGTVQGRVFKGRWTEAPTRQPPQDAGDVELTLSADCTRLSGFWRYGQEPGRRDGEWVATRVGAAPAGTAPGGGGAAGGGTGGGTGSPAGGTGPTAPDRLVNHALASRGARASQSSTYTGSCPAGPEAAIDGVTAAGVAHGCDTRIAHTNSEPQAWWRVDLGAERRLFRIVVWNRNDVAKERLSDFTVTLYRAGGAVAFTQTYFRGGGYPDPALTIDLPGIDARQVEVRLNGRNYLTLAEVQVFGAP